MTSANKTTTGKPKLVIVGSGWAGFELANNIKYDLLDVTVLSPHRNTTYTPLLASAATGLFSFALAEEPVRSKTRKISFLKASVTKVDFDKKQCICKPAFTGDQAGEDEGLNTKEFAVPYDILALCPGLEPNDFGTPGVQDYGIFMRSVSDAMKVRKKLFDLLEKASLPTVSDERAKELLHIAIVGGGPTGIELTAELNDMCKHELHETYPDVASFIKISVYDVAPNILPVYDAKLHEYATAQLEKRDVNVSPDTKIERVDGKALHIKDKGRVPYGMLLWVTGNKNVALVNNIDVRLSSKPPTRIETDAQLRVYKGPSEKEKEQEKKEQEEEEDDDEEDDEEDNKEEQSSRSDKNKRSHLLHDSVYALGDASVITTDSSLPPTAEVACQQARYLAHVLNTRYSSSSSSSSTSRPPSFIYKEKHTVSYIGGKDGVISGKGADDWTGSSAWVAWRGGNLGWVRTRRAKVGMLLAWFMNWVFGREVARL